MLLYYKYKLGYPFIPPFLVKYLKCPSLMRLKNVGYFCGMDYASKDVYDFKEYISRFDHSLTTSLMVYNLTGDKIATITALFHDVGTPCFSHVIDYMNKDYLYQESTEKYNDRIIKNDSYLLKCLEKDHITVDKIIDFKKYSVVDNERPKVCADRLDGLILTGIGWTKNITNKDIDNILKNSVLYYNDSNELEIGFKNIDVAQKVLETAQLIDSYCHSKDDNYMMELLARITKYAIKNDYIKYEDLYRLDEKELINIFNSIEDRYFIYMFDMFKSIKSDEIPSINHQEIKKRVLKPIYSGKRIE